MSVLKPALNRGSIGWLRAVGVALALGFATGITSCAKPAVVANVTTPTPKTISITPAAPGHVKVEPKTVDLSKGGKDSVHWRNDTSELLLVVLNDTGVGHQINAHGWSDIAPVCRLCDSKNYDYKIFHLVGDKWVELVVDGGPNDPQVVVGD